MNQKSKLSWQVLSLLVGTFFSINLANADNSWMKKVDPSLHPYLQGAKQIDNRLLRVITHFESTSPKPRLARKASNRLAMQKWMMNEARKSQRNVLAKLSELKRQNPKVKFKSYWLMNVVAADLETKDVKALALSPEVTYLSADYYVKLVQPGRTSGEDDQKYTYGLEKMGIPEIRKNFPDLTGKGVRVGVIDTGIDPKHPDLVGRMIAFKDFLNGKDQAYDEHGHGTHVSGTIAGGNASGTHIGVAPEASIISVKFLGNNGGSFQGALDSMQWVADPDQDPNTNDAPALVSNSWGGGKPSAYKDPMDEDMCKAAQGWVDLGIIPVFAAGNSGPSAKTVGLPGGCPNVLTVGATDADDKIASFSSRGPAVWKTGSFDKPNIVAPGVKVKSTIPGGSYADYSGTSMATPHVAGVLALMVQAKPGMTIDEAVKTLSETAVNVGSDRNTFGAGRVDAMKAVSALKR